MFNERPKPSNPLSLVLMLVLFFGAMAWLVPAMMSSDPRWFMAHDETPPSSLVLWSNGQQMTLRPTDNDFAAISAAANTALGHITAYSDFGPSEDTIAAYRHSMALELFYAQPRQIHSSFNVGRPSQIMFPLTGTGYQESRFFIGAQGAYWAGGPRTDGLAQLRAAVEAALTHHGLAAHE